MLHHMKKRRVMTAVITLILTGLLLLFGSLPASAASGAGETQVPVMLNEKRICNSNGSQPCLLIDSITYVPLRSFAAEMTDGQAVVSWNASTRTATVTTDRLTLVAQQNEIYLTANGRCFWTVGKILNVNGTLYVPVRPIAKAFGLSVSWDNAARAVDLTGNPKTYTLPSGDQYYRSDEVYWLSRIIFAEAGAEPFLGQIAVGNVILNRVASKAYPNTIYEVIFDRRFGTQFTPAATGTIYRTPSASAIIAAKICLEGDSLSRDMIYFFNPKIATTDWIARNCTYLFTIGGHAFYR